VPITSPDLDDLSYDRVVAELTRRIPVYSPEWTDFNDSDPGITLIQLFAYLAEMVGYRLNLVPAKAQINLLQLLGVELNPAHAATTRLALLLADPTTLTSYTLAQGASAKAITGSPPPAFETDVAMDVVPAEIAVLATTKFEDITNPIGTIRNRRRCSHRTTCTSSGTASRPPWRTCRWVRSPSRPWRRSATSGLA